MYSTPTNLDENWIVRDTGSKSLVLLELLSEFAGSLPIVILASVNATHGLAQLLQLYFTQPEISLGGGLQAVTTVVCSDAMARGMNTEDIANSVDVPSLKRTPMWAIQLVPADTQSLCDAVGNWTNEGHDSNAKELQEHAALPRHLLIDAPSSSSSIGVESTLKRGCCRREGAPVRNRSRERLFSDYTINHDLLQWLQLVTYQHGFRQSVCPCEDRLGGLAFYPALALESSCFHFDSCALRNTTPSHSPTETMKICAAAAVTAYAFATTDGATDGTDGAAWGYKAGDTMASPGQWADHYPACGSKQQSPIDSTTFDISAGRSLTFTGSCPEFQVSQSDEYGGSCAATANGESYDLQDIKMHVPSEHTPTRTSLVLPYVKDFVLHDSESTRVGGVRAAAEPRSTARCMRPKSPEALWDHPPSRQPPQGAKARLELTVSVTARNLTDNSVQDVQDLQLPETLQQLYDACRAMSVERTEAKAFCGQIFGRQPADESRDPGELETSAAAVSWRCCGRGWSCRLTVTWWICRDVSNNPIANVSAAGKDGPKSLVARNTSLTSMQHAVFPDTLRHLVTDIASENASCSDTATLQSVTIANETYSLCVLTGGEPSSSMFMWFYNSDTLYDYFADKAFDEEYQRGKVSSSTSLTTLLLLLFSLASAVFILLMLFIIKRKVIDERRTKAARVEKLKTEQIASEGSSDDDDSDKLKMSSAILTDDVRSDPDFERYRIAQNDLEIVKQLSKGAGGIVHLAKWKPKNEQVVVKRVAPEKSKSVRELQRFTREIRLYASLKHPKIVAFRGIAWSSLADLSLVIEYMPNGDLAQFLERQQMLDSQRRGWNWTTDEDSGFTHSKLTVALDIADALVYLHSFAEPIMHRDLKAQNVLLSNKWVAKISDFGVSKRRKQRNEQQGVSSGGPQTAEVGTAAWIAPEVIKGARYDQKADIYSFGIVMCELDTCTRPYALGVASCHSASGMTSFVSAASATDDEEIKSLLSSNATLALAVSEKGVTPAFHSDCPRAILDLARMCLSNDPEERPTAKELWRLLQDLAAPGALLTSSRKATLTESIRRVSTST
ncbi:unnamed protein product [Phytophthora lilii]|uniref:Unnamed protein product n=1 Tax=Phytophthora lilii TaxID=2077276 RepID=A0A9W6TUF4_9STRA|nr:unnamed protein product [Phytophthora lilii]